MFPPPPHICLTIFLLLYYTQLCISLANCKLILAGISDGSDGTKKKKNPKIKYLSSPTLLYTFPQIIFVNHLQDSH